MRWFPIATRSLDHDQAVSRATGQPSSRAGPGNTPRESTAHGRVQEGKGRGRPGSPSCSSSDIYMAWRLHHAEDGNVQEQGNPSSSPPVPETAAVRRECQQEPRGEERIAVPP
ncbi:hypothetical protein ACOMHN_024864 [Nucella lapillus]